jgi:hypothetical protein
LGSTSDHFGLLQRLPALVPETQLCTAAQASAPGATAPSLASSMSAPLWKVRPFPAAKLSRYVRDTPFKFLVVELRPFPDSTSLNERGMVLCGVSWLELYGEAAAEDDGQAQQAALRASAALASRAAATMVTEAGVGVDAAVQWAKDPAAERAQRAKRGLDAFNPTGAAARALADEQARQPKRQAVVAATPNGQGVRPILDRNASFMQGLREGAGVGGGAAVASSSSASAAGAAKPPPVCPRHPTQALLQRMDRKVDPPRTFLVCTAKDAQGNPCCDTKIYKD